MAHPAVDALRVKAHGDAVKALHDQGLTWVTFDPIPDLVCDIDFGIRKLPELGLLSGTVRGVRHVHAHRDSGDGNDDFSLHLNVSGLSTVVSRRGETTLRDGDAMLLSYSAGRTINRPGLVDHRVIRLPRASLRPLVRNIDDAVLRTIPRGTGMLNLLRGYADALFDDPMLSAPDVRQLLVTQLCDLVAVTLGATRDAAAVAEGRGIRAARLRAIKTDIEVHSYPRRSFACCGREAPKDIRKLYPQTVRRRRNFLFGIRSCPPARTRAPHVNRSAMGRPEHCVDCIRVRLWGPVLFQSHIQAFLRLTPVGD